MKKVLSIVVSIALVITIGYVLKDKGSTPIQTKSVVASSNSQNTTQYSITPTANPTDTTPSSNVTIKNGVQYITIDVKRGYSPRSTTAQGGIPTKIIAKTNESYGCETSLVIRSAKYQAYLPPTGDTEVDLGTPKSGETTDGVCGMGMYSFEVKYM